MPTAKSQPEIWKEEAAALQRKGDPVSTARANALIEAAAWGEMAQKSYAYEFDRRIQFVRMASRLMGAINRLASEIAEPERIVREQKDKTPALRGMLDAIKRFDIRCLDLSTKYDQLQRGGSPFLS